MPAFGAERVDVDAMEKAGRADFAALNQQVADQAVADPKADFSFIEAQTFFDEANIQFSLAMARLNNALFEGKITRALAYKVLGIHSGSLVGNISATMDVEDALNYNVGFKRAMQLVGSDEHPTDGSAIVVDTMVVHSEKTDV
jgi:hypothetical protein